MDEQIRAGETGDKNVVIDQKLRQFFDGKIVRKDLTKKIKEGANVPVYVLEFLLGQYCSSDDPEVIESGVENVKRILADNYVRPPRRRPPVKLFDFTEYTPSFSRCQVFSVVIRIFIFARIFCLHKRRFLRQNC